MNLKITPSKYQKYFLGIAIVLSSIAISITSRGGKVHLILQDYPVIIFLLIVTSSFLIVIYLQLNKRKITDLTNQIKQQASSKSKEVDALLNELTVRQKEVYDLIISGKTNKEIMSDLFIEQSTLKVPYQPDL